MQQSCRTLLRDRHFIPKSIHDICQHRNKILSADHMHRYASVPKLCCFVAFYSVELISLSLRLLLLIRLLYIFHSTTRSFVSTSDLVISRASVKPQPSRYPSSTRQARQLIIQCVFLVILASSLSVFTTFQIPVPTYISMTANIGSKHLAI